MGCKLSVVFVLFILNIILLNLVSAEVLVGNKSYNIDTSYGPGQQVSGWINISLKNEPVDSLLTAFDSNITIKNFLVDNGLGTDDFSCFPYDCLGFYSITGSENNAKTFLINERDYKIFGLKLVGNVSEVSSLEFNLTTDAGKSCLNPIKIDVLDDGIYEWKSSRVSTDSECYIEKPYGCFDDSSGKNIATIDINTFYCQKIKIPPVKGFRIGAVLNGSGNVEFEVSINAGTEKKCEVTANSSGEVSCFVELENELSGFVYADVCIRTSDLRGNNYQLFYEDNEPCGYSESSSGKDNHDFQIFAKPLKYGEVIDFRFNQDAVGDLVNLKNDMSNYIQRKYSGRCTPECIIPVKIYSGIKQSTTINDLSLGYKIKGLSQLPINKFYEVSKTEPLISLDFRELDLGPANIFTPDSYGDKDIVVKIGAKEVAREKIGIKKVPIIKDIIPNTVPALVPISFFAIVESSIFNLSSSNLTYTWIFGNGSEITTDVNNVKYTFPDFGDYEITVEVSNEFGDSTKTMNIRVVAPKDAINKTIAEYREDLKSVSSEINKLPEWMQSEINGDKKFIDLEDLNLQLKRIEEKYKDAFRPEEYTKVMKELLDLEIPYKFKISQSLKDIPFFQTREEINFEVLKELELGDSEGEEDKLAGAMNNWIKENLEITFSSETYSFYYKTNEKKDLVSYVKMNIKPKADGVDDFYFIINADPILVKYNGDYKTRDIGESVASVLFSEMTEEKTFEFLYPGKVNLESPPFYITPEFKDLETGVDVGVCNNNKVCDKGKGENYKNCRNDCKPFGLTLMFLFILLFIAFVIYIVLQEWYKRYYESYLFLNRTQLFNLINYINNAHIQGMQKPDILISLKGMGWKKEQLEYAWGKFKGERTGMWEIPVLKWVENRKVKQEIEKRKSIVEKPVNK